MQFFITSHFEYWQYYNMKVLHASLDFAVCIMWHAYDLNLGDLHVVVLSGLSGCELCSHILGDYFTGTEAIMWAG